MATGLCGAAASEQKAAARTGGDGGGGGGRVTGSLGKGARTGGISMGGVSGRCGVKSGTELLRRLLRRFGRRRAASGGSSIETTGSGAGGTDGRDHASTSAAAAGMGGATSPAVVQFCRSRASIAMALTDRRLPPRPARRAEYPAARKPFMACMIVSQVIALSARRNTRCSRSPPVAVSTA